MWPLFALQTGVSFSSVALNHSRQPQDETNNLGKLSFPIARMNLPTAPYLEQSLRWPSTGQHILAHFDDSSIVVYQAYRPSIGRYAIEYQRLGGPDFSLNRMSWIKPNFLWMMYRSGWGNKEGQEITLGLRLSLRFFDSLLEQSVPSAFDEHLRNTHAEWKTMVAESDVRLQWDPDHSPSGAKLERRAIQLGLRGNTLRRFSADELLEVIDMSPFVEEQRNFTDSAGQHQLRTPSERVYLPQSKLACSRARVTQ